MSIPCIPPGPTPERGDAAAILESLRDPERRRALLGLGSLAALAAWPGASRAADVPHTFPRLLGMNIGAKNYGDDDYLQRIARLDAVILGYYRGWKQGAMTIGDSVSRLKALNPKLLVGEYTILNESNNNPADTAQRDVQSKVNASGWWLRNTAGQQVQWTSTYNTWEINFTASALPDAAGQRYPQWLANRNAQALFSMAPFDIWYVDNVMRRPRVRADWTGRGIDKGGDDPATAAMWRQGYVAYVNAIRALRPSLIVMGNADGDLSEPEFSGLFDAVFLEGLMGETWSIEKTAGWPAMMARYLSVFTHLRPPRMVGFNVHGDPQDYRFFRLAYSSCLLGDGHFSFTNRAKGYSSVEWFDEYDQRLGAPLDPPPSQPGVGGVWRRRFEQGLVLVNPDPSAHYVDVGSGWSRLAGAQAPQINNALPVSGAFVMPPRDGLVLRRSG